MRLDIRWLFCLAAIGLLGFDAGAQAPQVDDAYISYRYARNLVLGHGLVFNVGEYVEGFTNLLWTLAIAAGLQAGFEAPLVGHALGLVSAVAVLVLTTLLAREGDGERRFAAVFAPIAVAMFPAFISWARSGMETPLFCAAVAACFVAQRKRRIELAFVACFVATLTRPEGVLLALSIAAVEVMPRFGGIRRPWLRGVALYAVLLAALTAFRLVYYGDFVPNTFYAKAGGIPILTGVKYALGFLMSGAGLVLIASARTLALKETYAVSIWLWLGLTFTYVISIGGDFFGLYRFLLPTYAPIVALAARAVARSPRPAVAAFIASAFAAGVLWSAVGSSDRQRAREIVSFSRLLEQRHIRQIERVEEITPWATSIAAGAIGVYGYHTDAEIIDYLGLTDRHIARSALVQSATSHIPGHRRADFAYVLSREPDLIFISKVEDRPPNPDNPGSDHLANHPEFARNYRYDARIPAYVRQQTGGIDGG